MAGTADDSYRYIQTVGFGDGRRSHEWPNTSACERYNPLLYLQELLDRANDVGATTSGDAIDRVLTDFDSSLMRGSDAGLLTAPRFNHYERTWLTAFYERMFSLEGISFATADDIGVGADWDDCSAVILSRALKATLIGHKRGVLRYRDVALDDALLSIDGRNEQPTAKELVVEPVSLEDTQAMVYYLGQATFANYDATDMDFDSAFDAAFAGLKEGGTEIPCRPLPETLPQIASILDNLQYQTEFDGGISINHSRTIAATEYGWRAMIYSLIRPAFKTVVTAYLSGPSRR